MAIPETTDQSVYQGRKDVLNRHPAVTSVTYQPDSIVKQFLQATIDPHRIYPSTGPAEPTLDVEWRFLEDESYYRIHYVDPNTGFNCGWHRDHDHPDLGPVHFQFDHPTDGREYERAQFSNTVPTEICWQALDRLLEEPTLSSE